MRRSRNERRLIARCCASTALLLLMPLALAWAAPPDELQREAPPTTDPPTANPPAADPPAASPPDSGSSAAGSPPVAGPRTPEADRDLARTRRLRCQHHPERCRQKHPAHENHPT